MSPHPTGEKGPIQDVRRLWRRLRYRLWVRILRTRWGRSRAGMSSEDPRKTGPIRHFTELNGRHSGETVFVIGAGAQLGELSDEQVSELEKRVSIGVNWTIYKVAPTYFLSAYIGQIRLAQVADEPKTCLLHMRPVYERPLLPGVIPLRRRPYLLGKGLPRRFAEPEPVLFTRRNVVLAASHLALILGARRIVFVGVEQRNRLHFFQLDPAARTRLEKAVDELQGFPLLGIDHPYESCERLRQALAVPREEAERTPFYEQNHLETFRAYVEELDRHGVEVLSAARDSVVVDAGARYVALDSVLTDEPTGA